MTEERINTKQDFDFFKTTMPDSRKTDFYLDCLDGSIFLDFNYSTDKRINLCRISFKGYCCCNIGNNAKYIDNQLSKEFIKEMEKDNLDQETIMKVVLELI